MVDETHTNIRNNQHERIQYAHSANIHPKVLPVLVHVELHSDELRSARNWAIWLERTNQQARISTVDLGCAKCVRARARAYQSA